MAMGRAIIAYVMRRIGALLKMACRVFALMHVYKGATHAVQSIIRIIPVLFRLLRAYSYKIKTKMDALTHTRALVKEKDGS